MEAREVNRRIERLGGVVARQKASHRIYKARYGSNGTIQAVVAQHSGDMPLGTLRSIEKAMEPAFGNGLLL